MKHGKAYKVITLFVYILLLLVLCSYALAASRPTWGPLTTPIPADNIYQPSQLPTASGEEPPPPTPEPKRPKLASGSLQSCNVQYTLFEDGELLLESGDLYGRLTEDPVIKNHISSITHLCFGDNLYSIGENSCMGLTELKEIKLGSSVESIGNWAFGDLKNLNSVLFSSNVKSIGEFAFAGCSSLRTVSFPDNITIDLEACSFQGCSNLVTIQFPQNGTIHIGDRAFAYCTSLMEVEIPNSVISMGVSIFLSVPFTYEFLAIFRPLDSEKKAEEHIGE